MANEFTEKEKVFFKRLKDEKPKVKFIPVFLVVSFLIGLLIDALNDFSMFRNIPTVYFGIFGLLILVILYLGSRRGN